jgi:hypothetical protein
MFDRELQEIILAENKVFFEWARQQTEKPEPEPIKLSKYENPLEAVAFVDLSEDALARYRSRAAIKPSLDSAEFVRLLKQQGLLTGEGDVAAPDRLRFSPVWQRAKKCRAAGRGCLHEPSLLTGHRQGPSLAKPWCSSPVSLRRG